MPNLDNLSFLALLHIFCCAVMYYCILYLSQRRLKKNKYKTRVIVLIFCRGHSTKFCKILSLIQGFYVLSVHNDKVTSLFAITILIRCLVVH